MAKGSHPTIAADLGVGHEDLDLDACGPMGPARRMEREPGRPETVGRTVRAAGINWRRAKPRITSPDEYYAVKKSDGTG
jgi:hypothetical protein